MSVPRTTRRRANGRVGSTPTPGTGGNKRATPIPPAVCPSSWKSLHLAAHHDGTCSFKMEL